MEIFEKMCDKDNEDEILQILSKRKFAPLENNSGWAELHLL